MRRAHGTSGSVSLLVVILLPALVIAGGLVLDGGRQLQVRREAQAAASAASRAAVQLSVQEVYGGGLDAALARARAGAELGSRDATGAVAVDGQTVTVTVTDSVDYYLLPGSGSVSAAASSVPSRGVQSGSVDP